MTNQTGRAKCLRLRCPKARRPTDPDHVVRDFPYPVPGVDFQALVERIGNVCPCGAGLVMLYDGRREPWEEPMDELPQIEQSAPSEQPVPPAPISEELEPLTPEQIGPLCDDSDPTIKLLARHLREQTSYLAECSDGLAYCQDVIKALARMVVSRDPEALVMALDLIEGRVTEPSVTSITDGWMGLSPSSWAVRVFALNFGRTLGDAPNCVEMRVSAWGKRMTVTIRREEGKSPMDLLTEAKAEIERLKIEHAAERADERAKCAAELMARAVSLTREADAAMPYERCAGETGMLYRAQSLRVLANGYQTAAEELLRPKE